MRVDEIADADDGQAANDEEDPDPLEPLEPPTQNQPGEQPREDDHGTWKSEKKKHVHRTRQHKKRSFITKLTLPLSIWNEDAYVRVSPMYWMEVAVMSQSAGG